MKTNINPGIALLLIIKKHSVGGLLDGLSIISS
jgi:hypothetical protein